MLYPLVSPSKDQPPSLLKEKGHCPSLAIKLFLQLLTNEMRIPFSCPWNVYPTPSKSPCFALLFSNNALMCKLIMWTEGKWRDLKKKKREKQNELGQLRSLCFIFAGRILALVFTLSLITQFMIKWDVIPFLSLCYSLLNMNIWIHFRFKHYLNYKWNKIDYLSGSLNCILTNSFIFYHISTDDIFGIIKLKEYSFFNAVP